MTSYLLNSVLARASLILQPPDSSLQTNNNLFINVWNSCCGSIWYFPLFYFHYCICLLLNTRTKKDTIDRIAPRVRLNYNLDIFFVGIKAFFTLENLISNWF